MQGHVKIEELLEEVIKRKLLICIYRLESLQCYASMALLCLCRVSLL